MLNIAIGQKQGISDAYIRNLEAGRWLETNTIRRAVPSSGMADQGLVSMIPGFRWVVQLSYDQASNYCTRLWQSTFIRSA